MWIWGHTVLPIPGHMVRFRPSAGFWGYRGSTSAFGEHRGWIHKVWSANQLSIINQGDLGMRACGWAPGKLHHLQKVCAAGGSTNTQARTDCQECWGFFYYYYYFSLHQTLTRSLRFHDLQSIFKPMISFGHPKGPQGRQGRGHHPASLARETEA